MNQRIKALITAASLINSLRVETANVFLILITWTSFVVKEETPIDVKRQSSILIMCISCCSVFACDPIPMERRIIVLEVRVQGIREDGI